MSRVCCDAILCPVVYVVIGWTAVAYIAISDGATVKKITSTICLCLSLAGVCGIIGLSEGCGDHMLGACQDRVCQERVGQSGWYSMSLLASKALR